MCGAPSLLRNADTPAAETAICICVRRFGKHSSATTSTGAPKRMVTSNGAPPATSRTPGARPVNGCSRYRPATRSPTCSGAPGSFQRRAEAVFQQGEPSSAAMRSRASASETGAPPAPGPARRSRARAFASFRFATGGFIGCILQSGQSRRSRARLAAELPVRICFRECSRRSRAGGGSPSGQSLRERRASQSPRPLTPRTDRGQSPCVKARRSGTRAPRECPASASKPSASCRVGCADAGDGQCDTASPSSRYCRRSPGSCGYRGSGLCP